MSPLQRRHTGTCLKVLISRKRTYAGEIMLGKFLTFGNNDLVGVKEVDPFCPYYREAVELVGRRWTGAVLRAMIAGVGRFSGLSGAIPGISDRMLSERLKELEAEGIVVRNVSPDTPVRIEYRLTSKGRALVSVVEAVSAWAEQWVSPSKSQTSLNRDRSVGGDLSSGRRVSYSSSPSSADTAGDGMG